MRRSARKRHPPGYTAGMQTRTRLRAALFAAAIAIATTTLTAPAALALGDGDGFVATLWGDPQQADFDEAVRLAASTGARHVSFLVFLHQDSPRASSIRLSNVPQGASFDASPFAR